MLFDEIENLIDYMNSQNKCDFIFKTDLTSSVVYAKVWFEVDDEYADIRKSDDFYFIKNECCVETRRIVSLRIVSLRIHIVFCCWDFHDRSTFFACADFL